jgi:hypothetical protein
MFGLTKLMTAVSALAENVLALSGTVAEVNVALRGRLRLDQPTSGAAGSRHEPATPTRRGRKSAA